MRTPPVPFPNTLYSRNAVHCENESAAVHAHHNTPSGLLTARGQYLKKRNRVVLSYSKQVIFSIVTTPPILGCWQMQFCSIPDLTSGAQKSDFLLLQVTREAESIPTASLLMKSTINHISNSSVHNKCYWKTLKSYVAVFSLERIVWLRLLYGVTSKHYITSDVRNKSLSDF
jgi:hypothetical protein